MCNCFFTNFHFSQFCILEKFQSHTHTHTHEYVCKCVKRGQRSFKYFKIRLNKWSYWLWQNRKRTEKSRFRQVFVLTSILTYNFCILYAGTMIFSFKENLTKNSILYYNFYYKCFLVCTVKITVNWLIWDNDCLKGKVFLRMM